MSEKDGEFYVDYFGDNWLVKVALHELLGHGSGKCLQELPSGELNFEMGKVLDPFTKEPITTYYKKGETFQNVFGRFQSAYEECRADSVAMYLCLFDDILEVLLPGK